MNKFILQTQIELNDPNECNGCRFNQHTLSIHHCLIFRISLKGTWQTCAGDDYYKIHRPEICKNSEIVKGEVVK